MIINRRNNAEQFAKAEVSVLFSEIFCTLRYYRKFDNFLFNLETLDVSDGSYGPKIKFDITLYIPITDYIEDRWLVL